MHRVTYMLFHLCEYLKKNMVLHSFLLSAPLPGNGSVHIYMIINIIFHFSVPFILRAIGLGTGFSYVHCSIIIHRAQVCRQMNLRMSEINNIFNLSYYVQ